MSQWASEQKSSNVMNKKIILVRHGMTKGNIEKRYVGSTNEDILDSEKELLHNVSISECRSVSENNLKKHLQGMEIINDAVLISSPMRRCRETCLYLTGREPDMICDGLREMNFGDLEYKNFTELDGNPYYQAYIDSNGEKAFPNGESKQEFTDRTCEAFAELMHELKNDVRPLVLFVHGGTIMALLSKYGVPKKIIFLIRRSRCQDLQECFRSTIISALRILLVFH